jgi:hypothetical protein
MGIETVEKARCTGRGKKGRGTFVQNVLDRNNDGN